MPTDEERRDVAHNIRENYVCGGLGYKVASAYNIAMAIGMNPGLLVGDIDLWCRLADLIEPSGHECVPGECPINVRHDNDRIDRDALLALADEIENDGMDHYIVSTQYVLDDYARRIREALGVER